MYHGILFEEIPHNFKKLLYNINDKALRKIYDDFIFLYFNFSKRYDNEEEEDETYIFKEAITEFLGQYKFFTYYLSSPEDNDNEMIKNAIICVEHKCIIIESINESYIMNIFEETKSIYINSNNNSLNNSNESIQEVESFCDHFIVQINTNNFVKLTICPIACYLIRRFYYPTHFFKDQLFFVFNQKQNISTDQQVIDNFIYFLEQCVNEGLESEKFIENSSILFTNLNQILLYNENKNQSNKLQIFSDNDLIELRTINNFNSLVMDINNLYLFIGKKVEENQNNYEIEFCKNYSHRCFTRCYGFVETKGKISMILYEFMCNGSLYDIKNKLNELYSFTIMNRIFEGIEYLHSNSLIHRDIKPDNILIDHDYKAYISDFETIRKINNFDDEMTFGFGNNKYASPEQLRGGKISFQTDIYSFALTVYYLFAKEDLFQTNDLNLILQQIQIEDLPLILDSSNLIQEIFEDCVKFDQEKRLKIPEIKSIIYEQMNNSEFLSRFLHNEKIRSVEILELQQYFCEALLMLQESNDIILITDFMNDLYRYIKLKYSDRESNALFHLRDFNFESNGVTHSYFKKRDMMAYMMSKLDKDEYIFRGSLYYETPMRPNYEKSRKYFQLALKKQSWKAFYHLGLMYIEGKGVSQNLIKAKEYFELGADKNDSNSLYMLGSIYNYHECSFKDFKKSLKYYERSAELNNSSALCALGIIYTTGDGVTKDIKKGLNYIVRSADLNNLNALSYLGYIYYSGEIINRNYSKAKEYFEISALHDNDFAFYYLGIMYFEGKGVKQNYATGIGYLEKSAANNNTYALNLLGDIYYEGNAVKQDFQKAKKYYEQSANLSNSYGLLSLGNLYYLGKGMKHDFSRAKYIYENAAKLENSNALLYLGFLYYEGIGVVKDYLRAIDYFKLSAKNNNSNALFILGYIYYKGEIVEQNIQMAKYYMEIAAKKANSSALYSFGIIYYDGNDVPQDFLKAKEYFELSAKNENSFAYFKLGIIYFKGEGVQKNYLEAVKNFYLSSQLNNPEGIFYCGYSYENGYGVNIDVKKAIDYYQKCIDNINNKDSIYDPFDMFVSILIKTNDYYYLCYNNIGLIYLTEKEIENHQLAFKFLKEAGLNEYSFGQNNLGLFYQFHFNEIENAKYMFERSSKQKFALAEYNQGYLFECERNEEEAIKHYILASKYEKEPLKFRNIKLINDERLEISKTFIICLTNLKLSLYYLKHLLLEEASHYFKKAFFEPLYKLLFRLDEDSYSFKLQMKPSNLESLFLQSPLFNLDRQNTSYWKKIDSDMNTKKIEIQFSYQYNDNEKKNMKKNESEKLNKKNKFTNELKKFQMNKDIKDDIETIKYITDNNSISRYLIYPKSIKKFISNHLKEIQNEIKDTISKMSKILYSKPYHILFGRIDSYKLSSKRADIDHSFFEGFGIDIM